MRGLSRRTFIGLMAGAAMAASLVSVGPGLAVAAPAATGPNLTWTPQLVDPPRGGLTDISCPSTGDCTEADGFGNAIPQTATGWSRVRPLFNFDSKGVQHVSCSSTKYCVAAGVWGAAVERAGAWSLYVPLEIDGDIQIIGVSCATKKFCVVADDAGQAFTWNGSRWSGPVIADVNGLSAISCPAAGVCFGIDWSGSVARYYHGKWHAPQRAVAGAPNEFNGDQISCPTTKFCEATSSGDSSYYSHGKWHHSTKITFAAAQFFPAHLACASAKLCMFTSTATKGLAWTTGNGHTWKSHRPSLRTVAGVDCTKTSCLIVGSTVYDNDSGAQTQRFSGKSWSRPVTSDAYDSGDLVGLSCPQTNWCMAEDGPDYLIDNNDAWTWPAPFPAGIETGSSLHCVNPSYCTANAGNAVATWNGSSWSIGPAVTTGRIARLSCPTTTFCMAIDDTGATYTRNGSTWASATAPAELPRVLDCASNTFCVGSELTEGINESYRWDGNSWTTIRVPINLEYPSAISCPAVNRCVLLQDDGTVAELHGTTWTSDPAVPENSGGGAALSCLGVDTCQLALGQDEILPISNGRPGTLQRLFLPDNPRWGAISCASTTTCVATNNLGIAYTGIVP